jgi:hypothetical protein
MCERRMKLTVSPNSCRGICLNLMLFICFSSLSSLLNHGSRD